MMKFGYVYEQIPPWAAEAAKADPDKQTTQTQPTLLTQPTLPRTLLILPVRVAVARKNAPGSGYNFTE